MKVIFPVSPYGPGILTEMLMTSNFSLENTSHGSAHDQSQRVYSIRHAPGRHRGPINSVHCEPARLRWRMNHHPLSVVPNVAQRLCEQLRPSDRVESVLREPAWPSRLRYRCLGNCHLH